MGGGKYGSAWNGRKIDKSGDPRWRLSPHSSARSGHVRQRFAVKFHGQGRLVVALLPGWCVHQGGGRKLLPWPKPIWPKNRSKQPSLESSGFGEFS